MLEGWRNEVVIFPGENLEALKTRFVELSALHKNFFSPFQITEYIFKDMRDPQLRSAQAAKIWGTDLELKERIRVLMTKGPDIPDASKNDLIRRALQIADGDGEDKDKVKALELVAKMKGYLEDNEGSSTPDNNADLLSKIAAALPT